MNALAALRPAPITKVQEMPDRPQEKSALSEKKIRPLPSRVPPGRHGASHRRLLGPGDRSDPRCEPQQSPACHRSVGDAAQARSWAPAHVSPHRARLPAPEGACGRCTDSAGNDDEPDLSMRGTDGAGRPEAVGQGRAAGQEAGEVVMSGVVVRFFGPREKFRPSLFTEVFPGHDDKTNVLGDAAIPMATELARDGVLRMPSQLGEHLLRQAGGAGPLLPRFIIHRQDG